MKRKENDPIRASALQIALVIALGFASAMLLAASFTSQSPEENIAAAAGTAPESSSSDTPVAIFTVTNTNDSGPGSLRQADHRRQCHARSGHDQLQHSFK